MQFKEGLIHADGTYQLDMIYQTQWTNNKGRSSKLAEVTVFAFNEERIDGTPYFVDENKIENISEKYSIRWMKAPFRCRKTVTAGKHPGLRQSGRMW
ncbi:MAG: hypothetical protein ACLSB9_11450 [Hydrogeniiclostridium mannosilyticum]